MTTVTELPSTALALELDEQGQDAFLSLAEELPSFSVELVDLAKSLQTLGEDLVVLETAKGKSSRAAQALSVDELVTALETLTGQVKDESTKRRVKIATAKLISLQTWRAKADGFAVPQKSEKTEKVGVFLRLPPSLASQYPKLDEDKSPRHVTMLMVGKCSADEYAKVVKAVAKVAKGFESFGVDASDYGEFKNAEGKTIAHVVPRATGEVTLDEIHKKVRAAVEKALGRPCDHYPGPFKAHVTLGYVEEGKKYDGPRPAGKFKAAGLEVWGEHPGEFGRSKVSFGKQDVAKGQELAEYHYKILKKATDDEADAEQRTVFGIVLEPETVDSQKDIYSAEEIEKTAWAFMEKYQQFGLMHTDIKPTILPLESYVAPVDFKVGGQDVKKGTWLLRVRVLDDDVWADVKSGALTGFSIGGSAIRQPEKRSAA